MAEPIVIGKELTKVYQMGEIEVYALRGISLEIKKGEIVAIMGPSGSGKSTMMNILGALDKPTTGSYFLDGEDVSLMDGNQLADVRNRKIGFVFQQFNLLPRQSALSNVELPLRYGVDHENPRQMAIDALEAVGLGDRIKHKPTELSGGEQQRVAIARAIVNNPAIVLADEPTGNLDSKSGDAVMDVLIKLNRDLGTTIIVVTHDPEVAEKTQRVITILDGLLEN